MENQSKIHWTFWVIGGLALIWNLMGAFAFYSDMTMTPESLAKMDEGMRSLYENFPMWKKIVYGTAVATGVLGSIGLLMRQKWCQILLLISFIALIIQGIHNLFMTNAMEVHGNFALIMQIVLIIIGGYLYWFSKQKV